MKLLFVTEEDLKFIEEKSNEKILAIKKFRSDWKESVFQDIRKFLRTMRLEQMVIKNNFSTNFPTLFIS